MFKPVKKLTNLFLCVNNNDEKCQINVVFRIVTKAYIHGKIQQTESNELVKTHKYCFIVLLRLQVQVKNYETVRA